MRGFFNELMRNKNTVWIILSLALLVDFYVYAGLKTIIQPLTEKQRLFIQTGYWIVSILAIVCFLFFAFSPAVQSSRNFKTYVFSIVLGIFISKIICSVFLLIDDIRRMLTYGYFKIGHAVSPDNISSTPVISRSVFLSWLGIAIGGTLFGTMMFGFKNKYNYQVRKIKLKFDSLPSEFKGIRIVQISDIHSGSFQDKTAVAAGVKKVLQQNADLILFTGDLVNDRHDEMLDYIDLFSTIKAPMGVYSTLGNHDYGDYVQWDTDEAKIENLNKLKAIHHQMGWKLMMNEHTVFNRNGQEIALLGIENWGAKGRFPKYGSMEKAHKGAEHYPFKILMSHDPSHWDAEVKIKYPDVDLMLAGHTHGMQFGIENPYFKWSPVQWMYHQWAGLYEDKKQKLYINRGFGFIGYPGRVGILPEITVIDLV